ncbi:MAG: DNA repair protein RecO [Gemmataceae bacterium]
MHRTCAIVLRTTDWSETSRIATLWTRDLGKVRALAKGGRRLRSSFDNALDLLTICDIVLLRKSSGSLDLLTEARVVQRFARLRNDLGALYAGYYVAELLADWTQELDPHPELYDRVVTTLGHLGEPGRDTGLDVMRFEMGFLHELGYLPSVDRCAGCQSDLQHQRLAFSAEAGGVVCPQCQRGHRDHRLLSPGAWELLRALGAGGEEWSGPWPSSARGEVRQHLGGFLTSLRGRPPRLLPYLGS